MQIYLPIADIPVNVFLVLAMGLAVGATAFGLGWLVLILGALLWQGLSGLSLAVFTEMTPPPGSAGGLLNPIIGSLMLTVIAVLIGTPIGILAGTYMAEYGKYHRLSMVVRFINDILLSAPSIVIGRAPNASGSSKCRPSLNRYRSSSPSSRLNEYGSSVSCTASGQVMRST